MTTSAEIQQETLLEDGEEHGVVSESLDTATCCQWVGGVDAPPREVQLAGLGGQSNPTHLRGSTEQAGWAAQKAAPSAPQLTHWQSAQNRHQRDEIVHAVRCHRRGERERTAMTKESVVDEMTVNEDRESSDGVIDRAIFYASASMNPRGSTWRGSLLQRGLKTTGWMDGLTVIDVTDTTSTQPSNASGE
jgi:hypothetical protein